LIQLRKSLKDKDKLVIYTVGAKSGAGEKSNVLGRTAKGSQKKKESKDCKKIKNIEYMGSANSMTVLYRSLNEVLAKYTAPKMRTVILMITDGEDDSVGKDIDKIITADEVKKASVPVYGILLNNISQNANKKKIAYTRNKILAEKNCRGYYYDCSTDTSEKSVKKAFRSIKKLLQKKTYVVNLKTSSNKILGKSKLKLTVDNTATNSVRVDYSDYEKDDTAPYIEGDVEKTSSNSISFSIQDNYGVNISDANEKSHYVLQSVKKEKIRKTWNIESVNAVSDGKGVTVTLTTSEELYKGEYILNCTDIRDEAQEENVMNVSQEFTLNKGRSARIAGLKETLKAYWWIFLIILVVVIGILVIRVMKKKSVEIVEVNPDELVKADSKLVRLTITDRAGTIKDVEWNVEGSLFVGRSNICNIFFDDDRLSKQHFVIEVTKMGCYIEDLESTNGTFVNGVKMTTRRMLLDGDVITAGREKIVFHVPQNQPSDNLNEIVG
jgi:hypothetical protein